MKTESCLKEFLRSCGADEITLEADGTVILPDGARTDVAGLRTCEAAEASVLLRRLRPFDEWWRLRPWSDPEVDRARDVVQQVVAMAGIPAVEAKGWLMG